MRILKEKIYRVCSGTKTYRLLEVESSDKGFSSDTKYLVETSTGSLVGGFEDNLKKAEKYFDNISSVLNWL